MLVLLVQGMDVKLLAAHTVQFVGRVAPRGQYEFEGHGKHPIMRSPYVPAGQTHWETLIEPGGDTVLFGHWIMVLPYRVGQ